MTAIPQEPKPNLEPLRILELLKNGQQKHGLRHENYQRYRGYCGRRVERIRKSLKFTNQYKCLPKRPGKFVPKNVTPELVGDVRFLQIVLFQMERNWAYAMQCKIESVDDPRSRKKFIMRRKLRKAVKWADFLESLVDGNELVQEITKMEVKAYCASMRATLALEMKKWKSAAEHYETARSGYTALAKEVQGTEMIKIYASKCREMESLAKLCRSESGDADVLLSTVSSINLNESEMGVKEEGEGQPAMDVEETKPAVPVPKKQSRKEKKAATRKQAKPVKPFFFDLALNFVEKLPPSSGAAINANK